MIQTSFQAPVAANDNYHLAFGLNLNGINGTAFRGFRAEGWSDESELFVV